jgi:hypothetical protein
VTPLDPDLRAELLAHVQGSLAEIRYALARCTSEKLFNSYNAAIRKYKRWIAQLEQPDVTPLVEAARVWALADRAADDRAADIHGIERRIVIGERPTPETILIVRDVAALQLREACKVEEKALEVLHDAARKLVDAEYAAAADVRTEMASTNVTVLLKDGRTFTGMLFDVHPHHGSLTLTPGTRPSGPWTFLFEECMTVLDTKGEDQLPKWRRQGEELRP